MTDEPGSSDDIAAVELLLARADSDGTLWSDTPPDAEADIVAAIDAANRGSTPRPAAPVRPRFTVTSWLAAAAALVVVVAGVALIVRGGDDHTAFALDGTDHAPGASADVEVSVTSLGLRIVMTPDGLPAAPEGTYYECWLSNGRLKVSAGTFHLRGGNGRVELWAGVTEPEFTEIAVTLEPVDDDLDSSGEAYLSGSFELDD